ncbi:MAG: DUF5707 domain-containing protein [Streptomyces sp.]|jgi:hypothetical protein|nr:DUF5707 domain-containing protein [Streptomyces sp.]
MRIRATVAAVSGALALSALAVPAAHADDVYGDTKISNVVVNGGKALVFGPATKKTFTVTFTASDNSGIKTALAVLWHGPTFNKLDNGSSPKEGSAATCTKVNTTTVKCKETFTIDARVQLPNAHAGTWKVWAIAQGKDNNFVQKDNVKSFKVQRASQLTVNASPEPVKKGGTLTVTGKLSRANWDTGKYAGYGAQPVKLQFRKQGAGAYTTLKTIKTGSTGNLKTTVKASGSGYYRYVFAGTSTTPAVNSAADYVAIK